MQAHAGVVKDLHACVRRHCCSAVVMFSRQPAMHPNYKSILSRAPCTTPVCPPCTPLLACSWRRASAPPGPHTRHTPAHPLELLLGAPHNHLGRALDVQVELALALKACATAQPQHAGTSLRGRSTVHTRASLPAPRCAGVVMGGNAARMLWYGPPAGPQQRTRYEGSSRRCRRASHARRACRMQRAGRE